MRPSSSTAAQTDVDEITLDVRPFRPSPQLPAALFAQVSSEGRLSVIQYSPNGLLVSAAFAGEWPDAAALWRPARIVALLAEAQTQPPASRRADGDLFTLRFLQRGQPVGELMGLRHLAPLVTGELINQVLTAWPTLPRVSLAAGYLRVTPPPGAVEQLPRERLASPSDFSAELQPLLKKSVTTPFQFHPLTAAQYTALAAQGRAFYLRDANAAHQLTIFQSKP